MGRFEDLVDKARQGDQEALDALESEFSGSSLRQRAEEADTYKTKYEAAIPLMRQSRLSEMMNRLDDDLKASGLTIEDFGDFDPETLSLEQVQDKAKAKIALAQESRMAAARAVGFDTVEEYEEALSAVKKQQEAKVAGMEAVAGGVAGSGGSAPGSEGQDLREVGKTAFAQVKAEGRSDDYALGGAIEAILDAQAPAEA